jgi:AraC-like DNA-binding protein
MPIYMDLHIVPGVNAKDVADAHSMDVLMEKEHSCKCLTYWIDELRGHVFCLIDAPNKESVIELHNRAHGLAPNKIIEVQPNLVYSFLGRITDPENAKLTDTGLIILDDTSYRVIMHVQIADAILMEHAYGKEVAQERIHRFYSITKELVLKHNGREVRKEGNELIASFVSGEKAFEAACAIKKQLHIPGDLPLRISIHAGEPVTQTDALFGDTVDMLKRMHFVKNDQVIHLSTAVKELLTNVQIAHDSQDIFVYTPQDETFLSTLFNTLHVHYTEDDFDVEKCGDAMAMSSSQLYRKTSALCGVSPNNLLKEYRLEKAKELMRRKDATVSEISFDTGFASPSYFTKCFKSRYDLLPMQYIEMAKK